MDKILVSACLLGRPVRYDGTGKALLHPHLDRWKSEGRLVPLCPEVAAGLPVPRPPAERTPDGTRVVDVTGADVTAAFEAGARVALDLARNMGCRFALLKDFSPSCGSREIHDGSFTGTRKPGQGLTAALLRGDGIEVFSEAEVADLAARLTARDLPR
ncbi:MAG: DUF523 domain-containing protein [Zavarzinia sp.]|nr:DUF523 domain-containing protein [Zavarzinia sp.]